MEGVPARPGRVGRYDHAMDDIRYFVMAMDEEPPVAAAYVERGSF